MARAIIFDMTQTLQLFDFARMQKEFQKIIKAIPKTRKIQVKRFMRAYFQAYDHYQIGKIQNDKEFCKKIFEKLKVGLNAKEEEFFIREHRQRRKKFIRLAPHLKETLRALKKYGFRLGLLSNGVKNWVGFDWRFLGFQPEKFFEVQIYSQTVRELKPKKSAYKRILKKMKLKPSDAVSVGDNFEQDVLAPKSIGMRTVWLNKAGKRKKADFAIKKLQELLRIKELLLKNH